MTVCNRCMGQGAVLGNWLMESCPECNGTGHFNPPMSRDEANVQGCLVVSLLFAACAVAALFWGVIEFFWAVLA